MRREGRYIDLDEDAHDRDPAEVAEAHRRRQLMLCSKAELIMMLDMSKNRIAFLDSTAEKNLDSYYAVLEERDNMNRARQDAILEGKRDTSAAHSARGDDFRASVVAASRSILAMDGQPGGLAVANGMCNILIAHFNSLSYDIQFRLAADFLLRDVMTTILKKACKIPRNNEKIMMLYDLAMWELAERVRNKPSDAPDSCGCGHPGAHPPCSYCTDYWCDEPILEMED